MKELSEAYTAEEVAKYLKLHPYTVRRFARDKKIPAFRVGGQWRFRKDDIDKPVRQWFGFQYSQSHKWSRSYPLAIK
ncbi:MAG: helix-turn-helix domain-containing protein [Candidatus Omnitrophica bacterium]|nr:helix-turn-helix domain-containing protein [Candidatus Omnitrophota bacterium]